LGIPLTEDVGEAPGIEMGNIILARHRNTSGLDFWRIGYIIEYMLEIVRNKNIGMCSSKEVYWIIKKLIQNNDVNYEKMSEKLRVNYEQFNRRMRTDTNNY